MYAEAEGIKTDYVFVGRSILVSLIRLVVTVGV